ncbi:hypothetical protein KP509_03G064200 [Ceratopteris richardii]|uniref:Exosome-associated factor Rrp6 N-terminal domain-containing protein n=1 Tax=Ceratopteris richardii TaxID=49495 RepID=A0A8T2VC65_CERRI|nr:hypothetical protein KP509_03G064200 [Ceratopteris richardii]
MSGDGKLAGRTDEEDPNVRLLLESAAQLADSAQRLQRVSDLLPTDEDFHYYTNFVEFCEPIKRVESRVLQLFSRISSLRCIPRAPALPSDTDDLSDWLVDIQDEVLEQVDSAFDLYKTERASQGLPPPENDAFMYQNTRRKRRRAIAMKDIKTVLPDGGVVSMQAEKCPIPFHVWSIPRPQDKFDVPVDNSNTPFRHPRRILGASCNIESDIPVHPLQFFTRCLEAIQKGLRLII